MPFCPHKMVFSSCSKVKTIFLIDGSFVNQVKASLGDTERRFLIAGANSLGRVSVLLAGSQALSEGLVVACRKC